MPKRHWKRIRTPPTSSDSEEDELPTKKVKLVDYSDTDDSEDDDEFPPPPSPHIARFSPLQNSSEPSSFRTARKYGFEAAMKQLLTRRKLSL